MSIASTAFQARVWRKCAEIPAGRVSTYALLAKAIGKRGGSRAVGNALNGNRSSSVPCHRIVRSDGTVGGFAHGSRMKEEMLKKEGIEIQKGKVVNFERVVFRF